MKIENILPPSNNIKFKTIFHNLLIGSSFLLCFLLLYNPVSYLLTKTALPTVILKNISFVTDPILKRILGATFSICYDSLILVFVVTLIVVLVVRVGFFVNVKLLSIFYMALGALTFDSLVYVFLKKSIGGISFFHSLVFFSVDRFVSILIMLVVVFMCYSVSFRLGIWLEGILRQKKSKKPGRSD